MKSQPVPSQRQLTTWCRDWQKTLRLQDWRVRIRHAKEHEYPTGKEGGASVYLTTKQAEIVINPFASHAHGDPDPAEVCIIHELLHLHFEGALEKELDWACHRVYEAGVDCIAWALYRTKYGKKAKDDFVDSP